MKIAFTSCFSAQVFEQQPVWKDIAKAEPDVLVLLGDSMYLDCNGPYGTSQIPELPTETFARHAYGRYKEQLEQPEFKALLSRPGLRTFAIWDDHDFLWNDAFGGDVWKNKALRPLVLASQGMFAAYRSALAGQPFPSTLPAWSTQTSKPPPHLYQHVDLGDVHLHLTDGRTLRQRGSSGTLLGIQQFRALERAITAAPEAVHLVASGSVFEQAKGDSWLKARPEHDRLLELARTHRIMVLSGDIHDTNFVDYPVDGKHLFEATASGAAIRNGVVIGKEQRNWGLLETGATEVKVSIRHFDTVAWDKAIDRQPWAQK